MNEDNWYQQTDDSGLPPDPNAPLPKPGMSTGMKVFVGLAIFAGVMALLCCGGLFYFGSKVAEMGTEDPIEIREIQQAIAEIELPDEWEPRFGIDGAFLGFAMKMATFDRGDQRGPTVFALMQITIPGQESAENTDSQMRAQFHQTLQQQGYATDIDVETSEERILTVAGEETAFDFAKGTSNKGDEVRQVTGTFSGRGGPAMLIYQVPEDEWDEEQVVQMIESIEK